METEYAACVLTLDVWNETTDYNTVLRAGSAALISVGALERGLAELVRVNYITRNGTTYQITPEGRAVREMLLAE